MATIHGQVSTACSFLLLNEINYEMVPLKVCFISREGNLRKGLYFVRKKTPSVIWILNA